MIERPLLTTLLLKAALLAVFLPALAMAEPAPEKKPSEEEATDPWDLSGPPRPFEETCFDGSQSGLRGLTQQGAERWLEKVEGHPLALANSSNRYGCAVTFKGLARLRSPWPSDAVLRLSLYSTTTFRVHFWGKEQGVILQCYVTGNELLWVAYRTTRPPNGQLVIGDQRLVAADSGMALLTTDDQRSGRTPGGTYEFRWQDRSLVMTKGDVRMLTAPLAEQPTQVHIEGASLLLRDIALFRGQPAPDEPLPKRKVIMRGRRPSLLPWEENCPAGAVFNRLADGRVELATKKTTATAFVSVPLIRPGLYEFILQLEEPSPGTGVYISDDLGRPLQAIGCFRDGRTGLPFFGFDRLDSPTTAPTATPGTTPIPYVARQQWLRLVPACGTLKVWTSGDGIHWGQVSSPAPMLGQCSHIGLYSHSGEQTRSIKLRLLQVRQLDALAAAAPVELQEEAVRRMPGDALRHCADLGTWQAYVWENQPPETDPVAWRRAAALVTLMSGPSPQLGNALLEGLVQERLSELESVEAQLRLLRDAALMYDTRAPQDSAKFAAHYRRLGETMLRNGEARGFDIVRRALTTAPLWTSQHSLSALNPELARFAILSRVSEGEWKQVGDMCRKLRFLCRQSNLTIPATADQAKLLNLVSWADMRALRHLPKRPGHRTAMRQTAWRHPLVVDLSKEAYNTQIELQRAIREKSYRIACEVLTSTTMLQDWGLVADIKDGRLFESLPTAIALALRDHPPLRQMMQNEFRAVDSLRVRQAIAQNDAAAIQGATVKYAGTPAAAAAHCWLGDRFLSNGHFALATDRYRQALRTAPPDEQRHLTARVRLAGAMMGHHVGSPVTEPVRIGQSEFPPEEFELLVADMLQRYAGEAPAESAAQLNGDRDFAPTPARFEPQPWGKFDGDVGTRPEAIPQCSLAQDWPARQMAVVIHSGMMIVANRFQVVAYELASGKLKWRYGLGSEQGSTHAWPLMPVRIHVRGGRVYTRMMPKGDRPVIVCLDVATGKHLWQSRQAGSVISDPLFVDGSLFALTIPHRRELTQHLMLTTFDPDSGTALSDKPLVAVQDEWNLQRVCQATMVGDRIVAAVAGGVVCCDALGQVQWVRKDPWIHPTLDLHWGRQRQLPPLVVDGRVYVTQPGVPNVECLDLETGRLHWEQALPGLRGVLKLVDDRLLIETDYGIDAVSARDGSTLWHHNAAHLLGGFLQSGKSQLLYVRRETAGTDQWYPVLVWLDLDTGQTLRQVPLRQLQGKQPRLGPMIAHKGRLWCFTGIADSSGRLRPERDIVELIAQGPGAEIFDASENSMALEPWSSGVDVSLLSGAARVMPGWMVLSGSHDEKTGLQPRLAGKEEVLVTSAGTVPTRLAALVKVPSEGDPRLLLEIGHEPATRSELEIRAAGMPLRQWTPGPTETADQWQQCEIDLSDYAGRDIWITILQKQAGTAPAHLYWKCLKVVR